MLQASWERSALCLARPAVLEGRKVEEGARFQDLAVSVDTHTGTLGVLATVAAGILSPALWVGGAPSLVVSDYTCVVPV